MIMLGDRTVQATCERCGHIWEFPDRYLTRNYNTDLCKSCLAEPQKKVTSSLGQCQPWQGEFDLDRMVPVDERGRIVKPGIRLCGNRDCVLNAHILQDSSPALFTFLP